MTATVAAPTGNQFGVLLAIFLVITFVTCVVLWVHEQRSDKQGDTIAEHAERLATLAYQMPALLEFLGIEIPAPVADGSPAALADDDCPTDEFPALPATQPDGIAIQVQSALIERPSPVPRDLSGEFPHPVDSDERKAQNAADIDEALKRFDFSGRDR